MLIIPLTGKTGRRNLPLVTLALILANCLVLFVFQAGEQAQDIRAEKFYIQSGLARMEAARYQAYRGGSAPAGTVQPGSAASARARQAMLHRRIESDAVFMSKLKSGALFGDDAAAFARWKRLRALYEAKRAQVVSYRYGLKPAAPSLATFFAYMFLHAGFPHLLGNMIFLWIMGCLLESCCGRMIFLLEYLAGGLAAAGLFCLLNPHQTTPLVGASGAIAGLMGISSVLFGTRRIKIFYSLGVYFNTLSLPAIWLLPLWVGNELFQLFWHSTSHVAYIAHVGGLAGGALMGTLQRKFGAPVPEAPGSAEAEDGIPVLMEQALERMGALDMPAAEKYLQQVLAQDPHNVDALTHLFHIYKRDSMRPAFHETACRLMTLRLQNPVHHAEALQVYRQYREHCRRPALSAGLYLQISALLIANGNIEESEQILLALVKKKPDLPGMPTALLKLGKALQDRGLQDRWQRCRRVICARYPHSHEARLLLQADT